MAKKQKPEVVAEESVQVEGADSIEEIKKAVSKKALSDDDDVTIDMPVQIKINRVPYGPGKAIVKRHQLATIQEMVDKKVKADLAVFVGKSYLVDKVAGYLAVKEVKDLTKLGR